MEGSSANGQPVAKKSKLSSLVSSRLKSVKLSKQPASVSPEEIRVSEAGFAQMTIDEPEDPAASIWKPYPDVHPDAPPTSNTVEWDSEKWNEDVIMVPRLSTITEHDEPSLRYQSRTSKLSVRDVAYKAPSHAASSVRSHTTANFQPVASGSTAPPPLSDMHPFAQTNLLYNPVRSTTSSSAGTPVRPLSTSISTEGEPRIDQEQQPVNALSPPSVSPAMFADVLTESPPSSLHFASPSPPAQQLNTKESSTTMSSLGILRSPRVHPISAPSPLTKQITITPEVNQLSVTTTNPQPNHPIPSPRASMHSTKPPSARSAIPIEQLPTSPAKSQPAPQDEADTVVRTQPPAPINTGKTPSKLAQLAQARVHRNKPPEITPRSTTVHTGVNIPSGIMSGRSSTLTTSITTSYQTLDSMASLKPAYPKKSKLHMKVQQAQQRPAKPVDEAEFSVEEIPMFSPQFGTLTPLSSIQHAPPSAFASLLVHDEVPMSSPPRPVAPLGHRPYPDISPPSSVSRGFAFDVPSPDDVISNARRGTALRSGSK